MAKPECENGRRRDLLPRQGLFCALVQPFRCPADSIDLPQHCVAKAGNSPAIPALPLLALRQIAANLERPVYGFTA